MSHKTLTKAHKPLEGHHAVNAVEAFAVWHSKVQRTSILQAPQTHEALYKHENLIDNQLCYLQGRNSRVEKAQRVRKLGCFLEKA